MSILDSFLASKGAEYRAFDPNRAKNLFKQLSLALESTNFRAPKKIIQILGTNGKGTCGRFLALALRQNNLSFLHFTSPHLFDFNERFYKNGKIIDDSELKRAHDFLQNLTFIKQASYFEYATFLAYILASDVDFLILEAGVGGEFDSTSVINRDICAFCLIDFDHTEMLGNTIEKIALTKLNAMTKQNIIGIQIHKNIANIAKNIAKNKNAELVFINEVSPLALNYIARNDLASFFAQNITLALKILETLNLTCDINALPKLDLKGRFEQVAPNIIIDVGHNESAAHAIKTALQSKKVVLVYNSYFQKNIKRILEILKGNIVRVEVFSVPNNERIISRENLEEILKSLNIEFCDFKNIESSQDYLVFGSFSVVEYFLKSVDFR